MFARAGRIALGLVLALAPGALARAQAPAPPAAETAPGPAEAPLTSPAEATVARLQAALLAAMQDASALGFEGRRAQLAPILSDVFDFRGMIRFAVSGAIWNTLPAAQQTKLTDAFAAMSIATYAERFNGFADERFTITNVEEAPRGARIVKTRI
jgi:phospholipid transport system substrate-binding protein